MMASTSPPQAEPLPSLSMAPLLSLCISAIEKPNPHIFNAITDELHTLTQKPVQAHVLKHTSVKESVQLACVSYLERHENTATERELLAVLGCLLALLSGLNENNKQELGYQLEYDLRQSGSEYSRSELCSSATATVRHESYGRVLTVLARIAAPTHMVRYTNTSSQAPHRSHEKADEVVQMAVECLEGYFGLMRMENQTEMDTHTKDVQSRGSSVVVLSEQKNTQNRPHDLSGDMKGIPRPGSSPQTNNSIQQKNEHNILISYIIAVLLAYVEVGQRNRRLKECTLRALKEVTCMLLKGYGDGVEVVSRILPGLVTVLARVITASDSKQGRLVTILALDVWASVVVGCLCDKSLDRSILEALRNSNESMQLSITSEATLTAHTDNKTSQDGVKGGLVSIRTVQWAEVTIGNIAPTLRKICTVTSHPNSEVRVQFATFAMDLLTHCPTALRGLASNLLDVMVRYTYDTYPGVSDLARAHVKTLSRMMTADYTRRRPAKPPPRKVNSNTTDSQHTDKHVRTTEIGQNLGLAPAFNLSPTIVEQRLHDLIMSIPRHIRTMDDSNKLEGIRLIRGYVSLLGVKCRAYFGNELHLSMLMRMLMELLTFDDSSMAVRLAGDGSAAHTIPSGAPEAANDNTENFGRLPPPLPKRFKYFRDEKVAKCIRALCRELSSSVSLQIVCEKLIPALQDEESSQSRQACLILTEMMQTPSDDNGWSTSPEGSAALLLSVLVERLGMQTFETDRDTHTHTPTDTYTDTHSYTLGLGGGRTSSALLFDEDSADINRTYSATLDLATSRGSNHESSERIVLVCLLLEALAVWVQVYGSRDTHGEADGTSQNHTPSQPSTEDAHTEDTHIHTNYPADPVPTTLERDEAHARAHDMFVMTVLYPLLECLGSGVPLIRASAVYVMKAIQYYSPVQTRLRLQSQTVPSPPSTHMPKPTDNTPHTHRHVDLYTQSSTIAATTMTYTEQPVDQWDSRIKPEGVDPLNAEVTLGGSGNLNLLIRSQIDVVIDTVSHHLLYPELYPQAASVLRVILDNSTCDVLPILSDVLAEMVDRVAYDAPYIRMYLPVFAAVVSNVHTWLSTGDLVPATRKWDQDPEEKEPPMKPYLAVTKSMMDVLQHFMSDEDDVTRIQVCTTIAGCFSIIRDAENELYPMVHLFWPPLLLRLRDRNPRVRMAALDCVCAIIETSTWFAKTRVVEDLLPILQKDLGLGQDSGIGVLGAITGTLSDGHSSLRIDDTRERAQACNHAHESSEVTSCRHYLPPPECSRHTCGPNSQKRNSGSKIATPGMADVCDTCVFPLDSQGKPTLSPTLRLLRADSGAVFLPRGSSKVSSVYGDLWFQLLRCVVCIAEHIPLEDVETPNGAGRNDGKEPERTKHVTSDPMEELPSSQRRNTSGKDTLQTQGGAVGNGMDSIATDTETVVEGPMAELDELIGNMLVNDSHADLGGGIDEAGDNVNANEAALGQHDKEARIVDVICSLLLPCMHELAPEKVCTSAREGYHQLQRKVPHSLDRFLKRSVTYYEFLEKDEAKPDMKTVDMVGAVDREKTTD